MVLLSSVSCVHSVLIIVRSLSMNYYIIVYGQTPGPLKSAAEPENEVNSMCTLPLALTSTCSSLEVVVCSSVGTVHSSVFPTSVRLSQLWLETVNTWHFIASRSILSPCSRAERRWGVGGGWMNSSSDECRGQRSVTVDSRSGK